MANFLDKIKIKTATGRSNKFDLSCTHVTTQDFFSQRIVYCRELMPKQSLNVDMASFTRLAPLDKPFFTGCQMINRAFFVPFRTVFKPFTEFLTDTDYIAEDGTSKKVSTIPYFSTTQLSRLFFTSVGSSLGFYETFESSEDDPDAKADFEVQETNGSATVLRPIVLTSRGRYVYSVLCALGYTLNGNLVTLATEQPNFAMNVSALPILAFCKVYCDWYTDPQYSTTRNLVLQYMKVVSNSTVLSDDALTNLLWCLSTVGRSLYDRDYFTSAFDNPLVPNDGTMSSVTIPEIKDYSKQTSSSTYENLTGDSHVVYDSGDSQSPPPYIEGKSSINAPLASVQDRFVYRGFVTMLNQYMLDSLKALSDYVKRYQLVGSRTLDRYFALFGIKLESAKLDRCIYVGKNVVDINVADVMSTAATSDALLGDYAAKGVGYNGNQSFNYTADEFGMFFILSTIIPKIGYVQGIHRMNMHIDRLDFFNGDFDGIGTQAIARGELWNDAKNGEQYAAFVDQGYNSNAPFAYIKRFAEYATARDFMSGDFRCQHINADLGAWHTFRLFDPVTDEDVELISHHDENFDVAYDKQYNRIFNYKGDGADHFYVVHQFRITSRMPMQPLYEQYDFEDGRTAITNLGGTNLN